MYFYSATLFKNCHKKQIRMERKDVNKINYLPWFIYLDNLHEKNNEQINKSYRPLFPIFIF